MLRIDGRSPNELRPLGFELDVQPHADGSCLVGLGATRVLCAVTIEEQVPGWMRGNGRGWLTAEYSMLPASTNTRSDRERTLSAGRTKEIQRLIGRSLRAALDLDALGERTLNVDCDVLNADGGTRTASIIGACVAAARALDAPGSEHSAMRALVAAISVGVRGGAVLVDLNYEEDSSADVDCNIVGLSSGGLVEVQGAAEGAVFSPDQLSEMVAAAQTAMDSIFEAQRAACAQK